MQGCPEREDINLLIWDASAATTRLTKYFLSSDFIVVKKMDSMQHYDCVLFVLLKKNLFQISSEQKLSSTQCAKFLMLCALLAINIVLLRSHKYIFLVAGQF